MEIVKKEKKYNRSLVYLVPCLLNKININKEKLINSYVQRSKDGKGQPLLLLKFKWFKNMAAYEEKLQESPLFAGSIDFHEDHIVFIFKIPEEFVADYDTFLQGKYSMLSDSLKKNIYKHWNAGTNSMLYKVLTKNETLREQMSKELDCDISIKAELSSKPDLNEETLYE